jgi:hypothetical protein
MHSVYGYGIDSHCGPDNRYVLNQFHTDVEDGEDQESVAEPSGVDNSATRVSLSLRRGDLAALRQSLQAADMAGVSRQTSGMRHAYLFL